MRGRFWDARPRNWLEWLNLAAAIAGLAIFLALPFKVDAPAWAVVATCGLIGLLILMLVLLYVQDVKYSRAQRVARATMKLQEAFTQLRDASFARVLHGNDAGEEVGRALQAAVGALAETFSIASGASCRACIKQLRTGTEPVTDTRNLEVFDLCRSDEAIASQSRAPDYVSDNSDFEELFLGNEEFFFANDLRELSKRGLYKNSHWDARTIENKTYKYLATMVWPIQKKLRDPESAPRVGATMPDKDLLGFLCVDSLTPGVFDRDTDYGIGAAFAAICYAVLKSGSVTRKGGTQQ